MEGERRELGSQEEIDRGRWMVKKKSNFRNCPLCTAGLYEIEYSTQNVSIIMWGIKTVLKRKLCRLCHM